MSIHLHKEIKKTEKRILALSALAEEAVRNAVSSFTDKDEMLAKKVVANDEQIDAQEIDVEEECLKILALHQPVAIDLRFIVAVLKINSDLERVGDHAVSIAKRALLITQLTDANSPAPFSFDKMIDLATSLLKRSIDALINHDSDLAYSILEQDKVVTDTKRALYKSYIEITKENPSQLEVNSAYMFVSRSLERIAEHAMNIAEDVIYMIKGEIVRHQD